jgi:hypothetical protein
VNQRLDVRLFGGVVLIVIGGALLVQNILNIPLGDLFWGLLFFIAGLFFISIFNNNHRNWWGLIPGYTFMGISILLILGFFLPNVENLVGGSIVLAAIGPGFINIFLVEKQNWWAMIPAGVLLTLSAVTALDNVLNDIDMGGVLLIGLGMTFALLPILPIPEKTSMKWAWIPAGILSTIGLLILGLSKGSLQIVGSILLILLGLFFIFRTLVRKSKRLAIWKKNFTEVKAIV